MPAIAQVEPITTARVLHGPFDYRLPQELRDGVVDVGSMLVVPFGRRQVLGVVVGLAERAEVQVAYAIGVAHPVSVMIETFGTEKPRITRARIAKAVDEVFDLRPGAFREELKLHRPIYQKTAAYGHFGRDDHDFTWERTDKAQALRAAAGV